MNTRVAQMTDAALMSALLKEVFTETYGSALDELTLQMHLDSDLSEEALRGDMVLARYFVTEHQEQILGVLKLSTNATQKAEIAKLYVAKKARALGLGSSLLRAVLLYAEEQRINCLWLKVWEENLLAIAFYERHGFFKTACTEVYVGARVFNDFVMEKTL